MTKLLWGSEGWLHQKMLTLPAHSTNLIVFVVPRFMFVVRLFNFILAVRAESLVRGSGACLPCAIFMLF